MQLPSTAAYLATAWTQLAHANLPLHNVWLTEVVGMLESAPKFMATSEMFDALDLNELTQPLDA